MVSENENPKTKMKARFLLFLPLLIYPFLTLFLWSMGIFKPDKALATTAGKKGFNTTVPGAVLKDDRSLDKMGFYAQADRDSIKLKERVANDPFYKDIQNPDNTAGQNSIGTALETKVFHPSPAASYKDPNEQKVYERIAKLQEVMSAPTSPTVATNTTAASTPAVKPEDNEGINRLENMMQRMGQDKETDPQMQQLNSMMDKILDMQHPERVNERIKQQSLAHKQQVFTMEAAVKPENISLLGRDSIKTKKRENGFYGLEDAPMTNGIEQHAIEAIVQETQTIVAGATVKLRLADDIYIGGVHIPKNSFVYGTASLSGERLQITVPSIQYNNHLLPVSLAVYDMDGLNGIYIPGSINRDVSKESADQAITGMGMTTLDPSLAAQATTAGIQAAKSLLSKKVKLIKVTLKAGYKVLLKDNNEQH